MTIPKTAIVAALTATLLSLVGCGGSDSPASPNQSDDATTNAPQSGAPSGLPSGAPDTSQMSKISECLKAAGIDADIPTGIPSGIPSGAPTDFPSGAPTDFPSGAPGGGPGGGLGQLADPEVQAALKACGIDLPSFPAGN